MVAPMCVHILHPFRRLLRSASAQIQSDLRLSPNQFAERKNSSVPNWLYSGMPQAVFNMLMRLSRGPMPSRQ